MPIQAKRYVYGVIAAGSALLAIALWHWSSPDPFRYLMYFALAVLASTLKLRLPGITGTYSVNFLFLLIGVAFFSLPETLLVACAAAVVQSLWRTKQRSSTVQVLFNMANLTLSVSAAFGIAHGIFEEGLHTYRPAVLALVACVYFVLNTLLVSGVLSLLQGKSLRDICGQWYEWSFPYYMVGAALVGLLPVSTESVLPESWLILVPLLYLVHFFYSLAHSTQRQETKQPDSKSHRRLPLQARWYAGTVISAGAILLIMAVIRFDTEGMARLAGYLGFALVASTWKVRLPGMMGTISVGFVPLLAAMAELPFSQLMMMSIGLAAAQTLWKPKRHATPVQLFFNMACQLLSAGLAHWISRSVLPHTWASSLPAMLVISTALLYGANTVMVATILCLADNRPLAAIWQRCYFWTFPYYLVGAAASGIMIVTSRTAGWPVSLLILPMMGLVYVSYRMHVYKAVEQPAMEECPPQPVAA